MKEIITKIYSSGNFPIVLFSTIGVLLVLFIITLLLAVSDTKKRQNKEKEESSSLDSTDLKDASAMDNDIVMVSSPEGQVKETVEEVKPILFFDQETNEIKGKCKLKPNKSYFAFEISEN